GDRCPPVSLDQYACRRMQPLRASCAKKAKLFLRRPDGEVKPRRAAETKTTQSVNRQMCGKGIV
ncbi:hypothetical protein, partial [Mesorhizobium sanjuanii]|uniref:hypothetical protein n=1 Tax=Mesorhizobium sanjuanii TaxID=2037900 RepID=UPI001AD84626